MAQKFCVSLHWLIKVRMTNIQINARKSSRHAAGTQVLPFAGYISEVKNTDSTAYHHLIAEIKIQCCIDWDVTIKRWCVDKNRRPHPGVRNKVAEIIRKHSGDNSWTGDKLFPVEFYEKKE